MRRGHSSFVGLFASDKSEHAIAFESIYELEYLYLLETDADVVAVRSQPETLRWDDDGIRRRHVPDFCVDRTDQIEVVEVKPDDVDDEPLLQRRTEILRQFPSWRKKAAFTFSCARRASAASRVSATPRS